MILPIHLLATGDEHEFGKEYVLLSKLQRLGFPVASGMVVSPPMLEIKHFLIDQDVVTLLDFETKQVFLNQKLLNLLPEVHSLDTEENKHLEKYWPELVKRWVSDVHSHYTRFGTFVPSNFRLKTVPLLFSAETLAAGVAYLNPISKQVDIEYTSGGLDHGYQAFLDDLVKKASKKLGIQYDYHFIYGSDGLKLTRIKEANHKILKTNLKNNVYGQKEKTKSKRSVRLFTTFNGDFTLDEFCDGYYLESENFNSHDQKLLALLETMIAKHPQEILYQVSDRFLKSDAAVVKFCRNKKKQDNIHLVLDANGGQEALMQIKRDLAAEGVNRKGKMKYWIRLSFPALLMQVQEIWENGFDGVVIDLDFLAAALHMRDITQLGLEGDVSGTIVFLEPVVKKLQKSQVPVILYGKLAASEKVIEVGIKWKVQGLVVKDQTEVVDEAVSYKEQILHFGLNQS